VSDVPLGGLFLLSAATSLASSWLLVSRLGRVGARFGLSEALLGIVTAFAADAPEITASVSALIKHDQSVSTGVAIGSNVFNIAALLGLAAVVAGQITLHRRVILLNGPIAVWISIACLAVVVGVVSSAVGLIGVLIVLLPYLAILGVRRTRLGHMPLPGGWIMWLETAIHEEELELETTIRPTRGHARDIVMAGVAILVVVVASVVMERTAAKVGGRYAVPGIVIGGLILAAVTSLPNAVAAVYFAAHDRGAAVLSTTLNSNAINVVAGLLLPGTVLGLGARSGSATLIAVGYAVMTALALTLAYLGSGLRRRSGVLIVTSYLAVVGLLLLRT
jgi:cation:H+ antiporter